MSDAEISVEVARLLGLSLADDRTYMAVNTFQLELARRAAESQTEASRALERAVTKLVSLTERLETLTKWLLAITILLLIAAAPPAIEAIFR